MVIVTKPGITEAELDHIRERVEALGLRTHVSRGEERTIVGCIGDEAPLREAALPSRLDREGLMRLKRFLGKGLVYHPRPFQSFL